jgi:hypothetical protein
MKIKEKNVFYFMLIYLVNILVLYTYQKIKIKPEKDLVLISFFIHTMRGLIQIFSNVKKDIQAMTI